MINICYSSYFSHTLMYKIYENGKIRGIEAGCGCGFSSIDYR